MPQFDNFHYLDNGHSGIQSAGVQWVLVHGYTCDHTDWQAQVDALSATARVVAIDLNGHGDSAQIGDPSMKGMGSDVAALVHHLELDSAVLVGHSMGCRVVLEALGNCRDRVAGIVLVDGSRAADSEASYQAVKAAVDAQTYEESAMGLFRHMFTDKTPAAVKERVVARCLSRDPVWFKALRLSMAAWDARELDTVAQTLDLALMVLQTTAMQPDGGRATLSMGDATAYTDYFSARFVDPRSRVSIIADTNHFPQFEEPDALNQMLLAFGDDLSS